MRRRTPVGHRPPDSGAGGRVLRAQVRIVSAAVAALALIGVAAVPAIASQRISDAAVHSADQASGAVSVQPYASEDGVLAPKTPLTVTVVVGNTTSSRIERGIVKLAITQEPFDTRAELGAWLAPSDSRPPTRALQTAASAPVSPGGSTSAATIAVPAAKVGLPAARAGVYGISAELVVGGSTAAIGRSTLVWKASASINKTRLAVLTPITVPGNSTGLISAGDLATYTGPDGLLTRQLDAVSSAPDVAIGIDPMIIASIRLLGDAAPATAADWMQQLAEVSSTNQIFPLQYGDADVTAELQAGVTPLLKPLSFDYALDPARFKTGLTIGETPQPGATGSAPPTSTATTTPTAPSNVPTMEDLLTWPYTASDIAWPGDDTARVADVKALAKQGYSTTILAEGNTDAASLATAPSAPLPVADGKALVADSGISVALRAAVNADTTDAHNEAMATLNAQLALVDAQSGATKGRVLLATLDRTRPSSEYLASQTYAALRTSDWSSPASLTEAREAPSSPGLTLTDKPQAQSRIDLVRALIGSGLPSGSTSTGPHPGSGGERALTDFATMLARPALLTGPTRNALLTLLGVGWQDSSDDWPTAVQKNLASARTTLDSVQIERTGSITVTAAQSQIPITVTNRFRLPVNIVLRAVPSNPRLEIDATTSKTISARSSGKVVVPVKARVGNGKLRLDLQLLSPPEPHSGHQFAVGDEQFAQVDVHADWEGIGATVIGLAAVLLFGFGIARAIVRRRRERRAADEPAAEEAVADEPVPDRSSPAEEPERGA
ncbi:MAG TPA: DUF6049 family protein [Humibacter sp.]|nr:DUF6049 family protein [Humibacter sp.]